MVRKEENGLNIISRGEKIKFCFVVIVIIGGGCLQAFEREVCKWRK